MNKESIEERIKTLEEQSENLKANMFAVQGALQDCRYWLEQHELPKKEKKDK